MQAFVLRAPGNMFKEALGLTTSTTTSSSAGDSTHVQPVDAWLRQALELAKVESCRRPGLCLRRRSGSHDYFYVRRAATRCSVAS